MYEQMQIASHKGPYTVDFDDACLEKFGKWDEETTHFIVDQKLVHLYPVALQPVLKSNSVLLLDALEKNKSLESCPDYVESLVNKKIRRNHTLVAIGGGIIQDITCFLASTMLRGVDWVFYPTTLLSQADSCIGSKSSINCRGTKNILGTFNPPKRVYLSTLFLKTLKDSEIKSGVGEMLKVHAIAGAESFSKIALKYEELFSDAEMMMEAIYNSLTIKKSYIEKDEFDRGPRLVFNYGHSFGHAIESATQFKIPHGIAVSIGCDMANFCAMRLGISNKQIFESMHTTFGANYKEYKNVEIPFETFLSALGKDKKNTGKNSFSLIFPNQEGKIFKDHYQNNENLRKIFKVYLNDLKK
jgi:3-dehydroquinate synthase